MIDFSSDRGIISNTISLLNSATSTNLGILSSVCNMYCTCPDTIVQVLTSRAVIYVPLKILAVSKLDGIVPNRQIID